jgi:hypothetical protein
LQKSAKFPKRQKVSAFFWLLAVFRSVSMNQGSYIFRQVVGVLPRDYFEWLVKKYDGNKYVKSFTCIKNTINPTYARKATSDNAPDVTHQGLWLTVRSRCC